MPNQRAVIVIGFDIPNGRNGLEQFQEYLSKVKPIFEGDNSIRVHGAVRETAHDILELLPKEG